MKSLIIRGLVGTLAFGLLAGGAYAKKPKSKQRSHLIYYDQFQKMTEPKKDAYLEALREAMDKMQEKNPSFAQYLFELLNEPSYAYQNNGRCGLEPADFNPSADSGNAMMAWIKPGCETAFVAGAQSAGVSGCQMGGSYGNLMTCTSKSGQPVRFQVAQNTDVNKIQQSNVYSAPSPGSGDHGLGNGIPDGKKLAGGVAGAAGAKTVQEAAAAVPDGKNDAGVAGQPVAVRCMYAGFMIAAAADASKNTCSPVTNICDPKYSRETVPPVTDLAGLICSDNKDAGSCQGGSVQSRAAKAGVVCNPLLYGLKDNHVICVSPGKNASKDCHANAGSVDSINALLHKGCDSTASVPPPKAQQAAVSPTEAKTPAKANALVSIGSQLSKMGSTIGSTFMSFLKPAAKPGTNPDSSPNSCVGAKDFNKLIGALESTCTGFEDGKDWQIIQKRAGIINSSADFQSTCATLVSQVQGIGGDSNADQVLKDGASQLGTH